MPELLLEMSGYQAWCCGFANRRPDGSIVETTRIFHLDHLNPVSNAGASHQIVNRAPLCPYHNIMKSNHRLHLAEYRDEIAENGEMIVDDASELIDLTYAAHETLTIHMQPGNTEAGSVAWPSWLRLYRRAGAMPYSEQPPVRGDSMETNSLGVKRVLRTVSAACQLASAVGLCYKRTHVERACPEEAPLCGNREG